MLFLSLIILDIFSHWLQMYSSLVAGDISHKVSSAVAVTVSHIVKSYCLPRCFAAD
jgi:hypothetical protein